MNNQSLPFSTCFDATVPGDFQTIGSAWSEPPEQALRAAGPKILLTATLRWPIAARLAIALDQIGCEVSAVCPPEHPVSTTRAVGRIFRHSILTPLNSLRRAIEAAPPDLVIPCDDNAAMHLHRLHVQAVKEGLPAQALQTLITRSLGTPAACRLATSRAHLMALAAAEGIRIPRTRLVDSRAELAQWLQQNPLPAVLKIDNSWGGQGVSIIRTETDTRRAFESMAARPSWRKALARTLLERDPSFALEAFKDTRRNLTLQDYIVGSPANRAVACWQGRVLAGISVLALETRDPTGPATVVRIIENPEMTEATARLVRRLGVSGLWGVDFVIETATGAAHLIEMNPRATPICHLPLGAGQNLPAALVAQLTGIQPSPPAPALAHSVIALFPGEWHRNPASPHLRACHHDIPWGEPDLVRDGLEKPWADRGTIARLWKQLRPKEAFGAARSLPM